MSADRSQRLRRVEGPTSGSAPATSRFALLVRGSGRVTQTLAEELARSLESVGWTVCVMRADNGEDLGTGRIDLVIGIDADVVAFRAAATNGVAVVALGSDERASIDRLVDVLAGYETRTSPIGIATIDHEPPTPIVVRATITAFEPQTRLSWASPITHQIAFDTVVSIDVDVPDPLRDQATRSPVVVGAARMGVVMTFRSVDDSSAILLHPDDDYVVSAVDGTDLSVEVDQQVHRRARQVRIGADPVGLRVVVDAMHERC